jgi:hypothetical protein
MEMRRRTLGVAGITNRAKGKSCGHSLTYPDLAEGFQVGVIVPLSPWPHDPNGVPAEAVVPHGDHDPGRGAEDGCVARGEDIHPFVTPAATAWGSEGIGYIHGAEPGDRHG